MKYSNPISPLLSLVIATVVAFASSTCDAQTIQWYPNVASASQAAATQNKLVMLHFEADWCRPCENLETFVFTDTAVQRAFNDNVIAVKVDADSEIQLVQQYGVTALPFDIALTPQGQVISKRKSPTIATAYAKMVNDYSKAIASLENSNVPIKQNLLELEQAIQGLKPKTKFEGQATSFTPEFPYKQPHAPSHESAELNRNHQKVISNPFVQSNQSTVANAYQPHSPNQGLANLSPPMKMPAPLKLPQEQKIINQHALNVPGQIVPPPTMNLVQEQASPGLIDDSNGFAKSTATSNDFQPNNFKPKAFTPKPFAPATVTAPKVASAQSVENEFQFNQPKQSGSTQSATPSNTTNILNLQASTQSPQITKEAEVPPRNSSLQLIEQSDVAARLVREKAQQKMAEFSAKPKVVMNDRFFGQRSAEQMVEKSTPGSYQAKISIPNNDTPDFVPPAPPKFGGSSAQIVLNTPQAKPEIAEARTKAMSISSNSIVQRKPLGNIEKGLAQAAETPAKPKYALHGKCPVTLLTQARWVDGDEAIGCVHRNRIYLFANQENYQKFKTDPDAFSPVLAGYDPVVFDETGRLVEGIEEYGVFMGKVPNQRIVLFASPETRARFQMEPRKYLETVRQAMKSSGGESSALLR